MKDQEKINEQIQASEQELAVLDEKRKALQARIEQVKGQKSKIKCGDCENRDFTPLSDDVIRNHLIGIDPTDRYQREFVIDGGKR